MTTDRAGGPRRLRCALFVDFDNVYIGLQRLDPAAAAAFASSPAHWLAGLELGSDDDGELTRRFLIRACYLNPSRFAQFRPNFTRAGFSVVDCPSLTQQGKSSADINLVLDAVDALAANTRYDEFVIVSADADFTPLALRCRADDRRVTIVTASPAASAYRAVADQVVTAEQLAELLTTPAASADRSAEADSPPENEEHPAENDPAKTTRSAREVDHPTAGPPEPATENVAHPAAVRAVLRLIRGAESPLDGGLVAQAAQRADPTLSDGWGGSRRFVTWLSRAVPEVTMAQGYVWDPQRFSESDLPGSATVDLPPLQRQVVEVTDIPNLPPERYRVMLNALAEDLAAHRFERTETARRVHDACQSAGEPIGRASVNAVIAGVLYSELDLSARPDVATIAGTWSYYVIGLCQGARMELSGKDTTAIRAWVGGGLATR